jgi:4-diphosphocytidyl-2-C-methyl-D-erythritol kinase
VSANVTVRVPAKVNLYLGVGPRSLDGYHPLATVFQSVSIYDEITISQADELTVTISGANTESLPTGPDNLVWQAVMLFARTCGRSPEVAVHIEKSIPIAAGMAGGSADAAATLLALNEFWRLDVSRAELDSLARELGSDVPFMLHGGCALGLGRGDELSPVLTRGSFHWVFATFDEGLSTPFIYQLTDELRGSDFADLPAVPNEMFAALAAGDAVALGATLHNDLQTAAVNARPELGRLIDAGIELGALGALVSGSGPTCAFLASDESAAIDLVLGLAGVGIKTDLKRAHGPVHGARVVNR